MGNLIESVLGYGFLAKNRKLENLLEFIEIANYLENALEERTMEEEAMDIEEAEPPVAAASSSKDTIIAEL
eukprot:1177694-Heterocapsa_arctica.AAC.1